MKTVRIIETFDGFPNGKDERRFTKGEEPELSNEYADLLIKKGHAEEIGDKPRQVPAPKKETAA